MYQVQMDQRQRWEGGNSDEVAPRYQEESSMEWGNNQETSIRQVTGKRDQDWGRFDGMMNCMGIAIEPSPVVLTVVNADLEMSFAEFTNDNTRTKNERTWWKHRCKK